MKVGCLFCIYEWVCVQESIAYLPLVSTTDGTLTPLGVGFAPSGGTSESGKKQVLCH